MTSNEGEMMTTQDKQDKDLAVAREMLAAKDAEIARLVTTLAERDALCEQQTRTIHGIPALMRERDEAVKGRLFAEGERDTAIAAKEAALKLATRAIEEIRADLENRGGVIEALEQALAGKAHVYASERLTKAAADVVALRTAKEVAEYSLAKCRRNLDAARNDHDAERDALHDELATAESREHALGVQVEALRERVRLLDDVTTQARKTVADNRRVIDAAPLAAALAALDAVPGDALAVAKPGTDDDVSLDEHRRDPVATLKRAFAADAAVVVKDNDGKQVARFSKQLTDLTDGPAYDGEDEVTP